DVAQRERHALAPRGIASRGGITDERDTVAIRTIHPGVRALEHCERARRPGRGPELRVRAGTDRLLEEAPEVRGAGWIRVPMVADAGAHAAAPPRGQQAEAP